MNAEQRPKTFGIIGVIAAFLALLTVLVGPSVHDAIFPKPRLEDRIADTAVKIRDRVTARLKGAPPPEKRIEFSISSSQFPYSLSLALVGAAIVGGCVGYLRREDHRYAYVACGVGTLFCSRSEHSCSASSFFQSFLFSASHDSQSNGV